MKKALGVLAVAGLAIVLVISLAQAEKKEVPSGQMGMMGSGMMGRGGMMGGGMMGHGDKTGHGGMHGMMGGQPATLKDAAVQLQAGFNAADPAPAFAQARVLVVDDRLLVLPGIVGADVIIAPTAADSTTVIELGLDPGSAQEVTGLLSGALDPFPTLTHLTPELSVTIGPIGPRTVSLGGRAADPKLHGEMMVLKGQMMKKMAEMMAKQGDRMIQQGRKQAAEAAK